ncbi:zinc finger MYM-type protein 1-like [Eleginops maclovinus]|uniref:zinc finger MYM-type protein 1-like n=1 Tax=Eleginops maclovinus TaxID=56733 RepID=UPI003080365F
MAADDRDACTAAAGEEDVSGCAVDSSSTEGETITGPEEEIRDSENVGSGTSSDLECAVDRPSDPYPSDRANFPVDISDSDVKRSIIKQGPCKYEGPYPRDARGRCFSKEYYNRVSKKGTQISRKWLCYSPKMDRVYCQCCWLFGDRTSVGHNLAWTTGINDWQGLSRKIREHEHARCHLSACVVYDTWQQNVTIDERISSDFKSEVSFWSDVLKRIADVTLTLASCNSAFRAHHEKLGEINNGNFLAHIELLARYDPVLEKLIRSKSKIKYLSPKIQNEMISIMAQTVLDEIVKEIHEAEFYSVILDTTQDISKVDQLSQVLRYVTIPKDDNDVPSDVQIHESFMGFHSVHDQSAHGLEKIILELLEMKGISVNKCRGQGYDGAATMSGVYSGLQKRISDREPNAMYVHCASHNLNLVLNDACQNVAKVRAYYDTVEKLYDFFSASIKRWEILEVQFKVAGQPTLKRLCPTRWASRNDAVRALRFRYPGVMKALTKISLLSKKPKERAEATGLKASMENFEFVFQTVIQASQYLSSASDSLASLRGEYDSLKEAAQDLAKLRGISPVFPEKRNRRTKTYFDELCEDERLTNAEENFKVSVFYATLDIVVAQVGRRFESMREVARRFGFLRPEELISKSDDPVI